MEVINQWASKKNFYGRKNTQQTHRKYLNIQRYHKNFFFSGGKFLHEFCLPPNLLLWNCDKCGLCEGKSEYHYKGIKITKVSEFEEIFLGYQLMMTTTTTTMMMMMIEMVLKTLVQCRHLTWLIAQEDFIEFSHHESLRTYTVNVWLVYVKERLNITIRV